MANVFEPDFEPADANDVPGFVNRRARVGRQAGTQAIIVLSGRPSIRTPEGWRELEPGELAPFPRGPEGAHQVANRGDERSRVLMLSELNGPEVVVYPDSGKTGVLTHPPGVAATEDDVDGVFKVNNDVDSWLDERPPEDG